tara:strand:+ start:132520 stop:133776 length:1257 start_codon:yes stop_codon:yes gene_type:complete
MNTQPHTVKAGGATFGTISVLILCFAAMMADGFDLAVMPLAMPAIAREWQLADTGSFGTIFSAGLIGVMVGAPLLGSIADRIGRKKTFIASLIFFGICTLAIMHVKTVPQLVVARFATGIGIGGALPLGIVISAELVRPALRARIIAIISTGATAGAALSGFAASWLLPSMGWRSMFLLGGIAPIIVGLLAIFLLTEHETGAAMDANRQAETTKAAGKAPRVSDLFARSYAYLTPLLWLLFSIVGLTIYFLLSWSPTLFTAQGYPTADVGMAMGLFGAFGAIGGLLVGWPVDWFGVRPVTLLFLFAAPVLAGLTLIGSATTPLMMLMAATGLAYFSLQVAINSIATQLYPAETRAMGVGWGLGWVRVGQLLGAYGGGLLVGGGMTVHALFWLLAGLALIGMIASHLLSKGFELLRDRH